MIFITFLLHYLQTFEVGLIINYSLDKFQRETPTTTLAFILFSLTPNFPTNIFYSSEAFGCKDTTAGKLIFILYFFIFVLRQSKEKVQINSIRVLRVKRNFRRIPIHRTSISNSILSGILGICHSNVILANDNCARGILPNAPFVSLLVDNNVNLSPPGIKIPFFLLSPLLWSHLPQFRTNWTFSLSFLKVLHASKLDMCNTSTEEVLILHVF